MKVIFIIIGVIVVFGLLISSGALSGQLCVDNVGCVRTTDGGLTIDRDEVSTLRP